VVFGDGFFGFGMHNTCTEMFWLKWYVKGLVGYADVRIEEQLWLLLHGTVYVGLCWRRYYDIVDCVGDRLIVLVALEG